MMFIIKWKLREKLWTILACLVLVGCFNGDPIVQCEYEIVKRDHWLSVPFSIEPIQLTYQVGDTLTISSSFDNVFFDQFNEVEYTIDGLPFRPYLRFMQVKEPGSPITPGLESMDIIMDVDRYGMEHVRGSSPTGNHIKWTIHEDQGQYEFRLQVVLRETGEYLMQSFDYYNTIIHEEFNEEALRISKWDFDGRCQHVQIIYEINGDDHIVEAVELMALANETILKGLGAGYISNQVEDDRLTAVSSFPIEYSAGYYFRVE